MTPEAGVDLCFHYIRDSYLFMFAMYIRAAGHIAEARSKCVLASKHTELLAPEQDIPVFQPEIDVTVGYPPSIMRREQDGHYVGIKSLF